MTEGEYFQTEGYKEYLDYSLQPAARIEQIENVLAVLEERLLNLFPEMLPAAVDFGKLDVLLEEFPDFYALQTEGKLEFSPEIVRILEAVRFMLSDAKVSLLNLSVIKFLPEKLPILLAETGIRPKNLSLGLDLGRGDSFEVMLEFLRVFGDLETVFLPRAKLSHLTSEQLKKLVYLGKPELVLQFQNSKPLSLREAEAQINFDLNLLLSEIFGEASPVIDLIMSGVDAYKRDVGNGLIVAGLNETNLSAEQSARLGEIFKRLQELKILPLITILTVKGVSNPDTLINFVEQIPSLTRLIVRVEKEALTEEHRQRLQSIVDSSDRERFTLRYGPGQNSVLNFSKISVS